MKPVTRIILAFLVLIAVAAFGGAACGSESDGGSPTPPSATSTPSHVFQRSTLRGPQGDISVEVARTDLELHTGLEGRPSLAQGTGMLYVYPATVRFDGSAHWWQTTDYRFPIDVVWIRANGTVAGITQDVVPSSQHYSFSTPVRFVLELNAFDAERLGLRIGTVLRSSLFNVDQATGGGATHSSGGSLARPPSPRGLPTLDTGFADSPSESFGNSLDAPPDQGSRIVPLVPGSSRTTCNDLGSYTYCNGSNGTRATCNDLGSYTYCNSSNGSRSTCNDLGSYTYCNGSNGSRSTCNDLGSYTYCNGSDGGRATCNDLGSYTYCNRSDGSRSTCNDLGSYTYCNTYP